MKASVRMLCAGTALAMASVASAQVKPALQVYTGGIQKVDPISVTPIYVVNGERVLGPTIPYNPAGVTDAVGVKTFDQGEVDSSTGAPLTGCLAGCPGCRWYFGATYWGPLSAEKAVSGLTTGNLSDLTYAWYSDIARPANNAKIIEFYSNMDETCAGPALGTFVGGIILTYGPIGAGGWYSHILDVTTLNIPVGPGINMIHADAVNTVAGTFTLAAANTQWFRWNVAPGFPGVASPKDWDDDFPANGVYGAGECYDSFVGDPCQGAALNGPMITIWQTGSTGPDCSCVDFNNDTEFDFSDIEGFLAAYNAQIPGNCRPGADFNNDTEFDFSDIEQFLAQYTVCAG